MSNNVIGVIEESNKLPHIPQQISEILNMLFNPATVDLDELIIKISKCSNLEDMLLKYLNFGYANFTRRKNSLKDTIIFLGAQNVKSILISFITKLLLPDNTGKSEVFSSSKYWKHCIGTSVAGAMICEKTGISDKYKMFSYGLIHDIGVTVLDICMPGLLDKIHDLQIKGIHQIVAEKIALGGITHTDIGVWLCKRWNLPEEFINIVGFHHLPLLATANHSEVRIIHVADTISTTYYERLLGINSKYIHSEEVMKSIGITKSDVDGIFEKLPGEVDKYSRLIDFHTVFTLERAD